MILAASLLLLASGTPPSTPDLGKAEGQCRAGESGPSFLVEAIGLKDRKGRLKLELYPANDTDFLQDDNILVGAGKPFRRIEIPVPERDPVLLCIRAPEAGIYALSLLHDRDSNRKFGLTVDGVGFSRNPKLGLSKPRAAAVAVRAGPGPTPVRVVLNYRQGLFSFAPIGR